jgi:hypothetical protein
MNQNQESQQQQQEFIDSKAAVKADAKGLFTSIKIFLDMIQIVKPLFLLLKQIFLLKALPHGFLFVQFL